MVYITVSYLLALWPWDLVLPATCILMLLCVIQDNGRVSFLGDEQRKLEILVPIECSVNLSCLRRVKSIVCKHNEAMPLIDQGFGSMEELCLAFA